MYRKNSTTTINGGDARGDNVTQGAPFGRRLLLADCQIPGGNNSGVSRKGAHRERADDDQNHADRCEPFDNAFHHNHPFEYHGLIDGQMLSLVYYYMS